MEVPAEFRLARIEGSAQRGMLRLSDSERPRLEIAWTTPRRVRDAQALTRRKLIRAIGRSAGAVESRIAPVANPHFESLLGWSDEEAGLDRWTGFCRQTSRLIECAYHRAVPREDEQVRQLTMPTLLDQPRRGPSRWAFFDVSFIVPPGFAYRSSRLNLGDMRVELIASRNLESGPSLTIRQIYPASLGLSRQSLRRWQEEWLRNFQSMFRAPGVGLLGRGEPEILEHATARGPMLATRAPLRLLLRLLRWSMPRQAGIYFLHDVAADRLIALQVADKPERIDALAEEVFRGLHWVASQG